MFSLMDLGEGEREIRSETEPCFKSDHVTLTR